MKLYLDRLTVYDRSFTIGIPRFGGFGPSILHACIDN